MYKYIKKLLICLILIIIILLFFVNCILNLKEDEINKLNTLIIKQNNLNLKLKNQLHKQQIQNVKIKDEINKIKKRRILTEDDINSLERIVEAEASTEGLKGKILVASVVLNRWLAANDKSVDEIVKAPRQFDPVDNGKYYSVKPSTETKQAVAMAIERDYSEGSRFFMNPEISSRGNVNWFRKALKLKIKHGSHEFYSPK